MLKNDVTVIHGILPDSEIQFKRVSSAINCCIKIYNNGILKL